MGRAERNIASGIYADTRSEADKLRYSRNTAIGASAIAFAATSIIEGLVVLANHAAAVADTPQPFTPAEMLIGDMVGATIAFGGLIEAIHLDTLAHQQDNLAARAHDRMLDL